MKRFRICRIQGGLIVGLALAWAVGVQAAAIRNLPGLRASSLPANDDGSSTAAIPLGFTVNFYGTNFPSCWVNNNGNITFDQPSSTFTPFGLTNTTRQIIAAFFADVDTRGVGSGLTTYGTDTLNGRPVFGVDWFTVGYFASQTDKLNSFQLLLIDRSDVGIGDFDIEFNYDRIIWETGSASGGVNGLGGTSATVGFSNGTQDPGTYFELPGSRIPGTFLDSNLATGLIYNRRESNVNGRYLFRVRGGQVQFGDVEFTKTTDGSLASLGQDLLYNIQLVNSGTNTFTNFTLTDELNETMQYVAHTISQGTCVFTNNVLTCAIGTVNPGGTVTATLTVTPSRIGDVCNTARIISTNEASIAAEACVTVVPARIHGECITRSARYWFTHAYNDDVACATLLEALRVNNGQMDLGFIKLPTTYRNSDNALTAVDTLMEALGLYWRSQGRTGEDGGKQSAKLPGSKLCKYRKQLSVEIIAATANFIYLATYPSDCSYNDGGSSTNFPVDLITQARTAAASEDPVLMKTYTVLLRKFNSSGATQNFYGGNLQECTSLKTSMLRQISRDPTTQITCPGVNDTCEAAQNVTKFPFSQSVNLAERRDNFENPACDPGGQNAVWKIKPLVAANGRRFVIDPAGSNIGTVWSVWSGDSCDSRSEVSCLTSEVSVGQTNLTFTADGQSTYWIVGEGLNGQLGRIKLRITSY